MSDTNSIPRAAQKADAEGMTDAAIKIQAAFVVLSSLEKLAYRLMDGEDDEVLHVIATIARDAQSNLDEAHDILGNLIDAAAKPKAA
ncbi:hypothetical protein B1C78_03230 [Thioalkalivibrio denitrificans]|uniref:Uncharacterized protein n=1 Tax=Thioalkalivibrio denitrificans TaxID=108003 RepID=A0A1V3NRF1_9GAMM|nr:hypothetical protein [Thioalkalivibrio denitrificans]OOG27677.1 hypothetical protein B1C78_03230 [Thioalkalivibrio denitrificans]